ncbi:MAG: IS3 family transposase [Acidimicrobiales bacterium]
MELAHTTYYEHKFHVPSDREIRRLLLTPLIADIHQRSRGTYGMLRIRGALRIEHDMIVNRKLILSIMRELGIQGLPGPKKQKKNLVNVATEEDLVQRNFTASGPEVLWLTDITEHPTREGDNAPMESFWGSMQIELLNRQKWRTKIELSIAMADYIVHFYNEERRHSSIDYLTPKEFEDLHSRQTQTTF